MLDAALAESEPMVLCLDDIRWSVGMEEVWTRICLLREGVSMVVDFGMGSCCSRPSVYWVTSDGEDEAPGVLGRGPRVRGLVGDSMNQARPREGQVPGSVAAATRQLGSVQYDKLCPGPRLKVWRAYDDV